MPNKVPSSTTRNRKQPKEAVLFDLDEIHELIMTNDGTGLADALCESQPHSQFLNYVNSELLLSIATHKNKPNAVKVWKSLHYENKIFRLFLNSEPVF